MRRLMPLYTCEEGSEEGIRRAAETEAETTEAEMAVVEATLRHEGAVGAKPPIIIRC